MIRVVIADDHTIVRKGLKDLIGETSDIAVVAEAGDAPETLESIRRCVWDVLMLDLTMPGRSGLELLREVKIAFPKLPVLVLSMHPEDQFAVRALKAGASGYLTKSSAPSEFIVAIRKVYAGRKYISPALAESLAAGLGIGTDQSLHANLSDRELQVLQLIAAGKKGKEIAEQLLLSAKTVNTYRTRILDKMQMKSDVQLIRYAIEYGLVE
jgi:DNA-binding NarL/FixJ family response regulator